MKNKWSKQIKCNGRCCDRFNLFQALADGERVYLDVPNQKDYRHVGVEIWINLIKRVPGASVHCYYFEGHDHGIVEFRGQYDFLRDDGWFQWRCVKK
jgi:hypothetical protein